MLMASPLTATSFICKFSVTNKWPVAGNGFSPPCCLVAVKSWHLQRLKKPLTTHSRVLKKSEKRRGHEARPACMEPCGGQHGGGAKGSYNYRIHPGSCLNRSHFLFCLVRLDFWLAVSHLGRGFSFACEIFHTGKRNKKKSRAS